MNMRHQTGAPRFKVLMTVLVVLFTGALVYALHSAKASINQYSSVDRAPGIHPDYSGVVLPANIAPLNFQIQESGSRYVVKVHSRQGKAIEVSSRSAKIRIPERSWHQLLDANREQQLFVDVYAKNDSGGWVRFKTITNRIASEDIDDFIVYRRIHPGHSTWGDMGIYQRNLRNFDESPILHNGYYQNGCLNCHTFCGNRTDKMLIGIRSSRYGSSALLIDNGVPQKIGTKFGYSCWHPSGRLAVYSINRIRLFFHLSRTEVRGVTDLDSALAYYDVDSQAVRTSPKISRKDRLETYPTWSPDGRYLYFCSAAIPWSDRHTVPPENFDQVKYDLVRIGYDLDRDQWGDLETVLSAKDTQLCILMPRISPDGRWLLCCMCDYGSFPVYHDTSDLYIIDLQASKQNGRYEYRRLQINSDESESWHSWSSNSRWIAFSSKRKSGVFTRTYLAYVDREGKVHKPFVLPQKDPAYYDSCLWTYSVPELVTQTVPVIGEKLGRVVRGSRKIAVDVPVTMATPKPGGPPGEGIWRERE